MPKIRRGPDFGSSSAGPVRTFRPYGTASGRNAVPRTETNNMVFEEESYLWGLRSRFDIFDDFVQYVDSGGTNIISPFRRRTTTTAGAPTVSKTANVANGVIQALLANNNEVEFAGIDFTDDKILDPTKDLQFETRIRIPTAITTAQDVIAGFATNYNSTLASISKYAWFRFSASMAATVESADGTTTTLAQASNFTATANTFFMLTVIIKGPLGRNSGLAEFWVNDNIVGTTNVAAFVTTDVLQPIVGVRKASGATTPALDIDWVRVMQDRF